jgi:hypothetical protein
MARYDGMGLLWMLQDEQVIELTDRLARVSDGLTFYRRHEWPRLPAPTAAQGVN